MGVTLCAPILITAAVWLVREREYIAANTAE
jgi:hypothetical protein